MGPHSIHTQTHSIHTQYTHTVYTHKHTVYIHSIHTHRIRIHTLKRYWRGGAAIILDFLDQKDVSKGHFRDRCKKKTPQILYILSLVLLRLATLMGPPRDMGPSGSARVPKWSVRPCMCSIMAVAD